MNLYWISYTYLKNRTIITWNNWYCSWCRVGLEIKYTITIRAIEENYSVIVICWRNIRNIDFHLNNRPIQLNKCLYNLNSIWRTLISTLSTIGLTEPWSMPTFPGIIFGPSLLIFWNHLRNTVQQENRRNNKYRLRREFEYLDKHF